MFISIFLITLLVPIILGFITFKIRSLKSSSLYTFKYPKFLVIFFLISTIILTAVNVWLCLSYKENQKAFVFLFPFYLLFAIAVAWQFLKTLNYQLSLEEDYILYRNLWRVVKRIKYEEISEIKKYNDKSNNPIKYKICIGNKKICVDNYTMNFNDFSKIMKKRLKKIKSNIKF